MKSEERHHLQSNDLEKFTKALGKFFERYGKKVFIALVAFVVVVILVVVTLNWGKSANSKRWKDLINSLGTPESSENVADNAENKGTIVSAIAYLNAGQMNFENGFRLYFRDRDGGLSDLKKARENFESALDVEKAPNWVRERALYGLAACIETMSDKDTSEAISAYQRLLKEYPQTVYKRVAENHIEELKKDSSRNFYAFLRSHDRKPDDINRPFDLRTAPNGTNRFGTIPVEEPVNLPFLPDALREPAPYLGFPKTGDAKDSPFGDFNPPPLVAPRPKIKKSDDGPSLKPKKQ